VGRKPQKRLANRELLEFSTKTFSVSVGSARLRKISERHRDARRY
jgi:hypothetical protein